MLTILLDLVCCLAAWAALAYLHNPAFIQLLLHRFRRIAQLYGQGIKPLAKNSLEASNWNWLYNATDKLTKRWLTHGAKLLQQVTASAKSGADAGDMLQRNASGSSTSSWQSACGDAFGHTMMDQQLSKLMQKTSGGPSKPFIGHGCLHHTSPCFIIFWDVPGLAARLFVHFFCYIVCSHMHMSALMTLLIADVSSLVLCIMLGAYLLLLSLGIHVNDDSSCGAII